MFIDIESFYHERFTSGLHIQIREIFKRLVKKDYRPTILTLTHEINNNFKPKNNAKVNHSYIDDISLIEAQLPKSFQDFPEEYASVIDTEIKDLDPKLIIFSVPSVFFNKGHLLILKTILKRNINTISIIGDPLFPNSKDQEKQLVDEYYGLLAMTKVITFSSRLSKLFFSESNIHAKVIPNLFSINEIVAKNGAHKYISLINHHPIKGREIFNAIAIKIPTKSFLVVENWPDVPEYIKPSSNVTFSTFIPNIRQLYGKIKILLVPSLWEEGAGRVVIEAMLNGIPVIAHKIGGISEFANGYVHFVTPPPIQKMPLIGTVLTPEILPSDVEKTSNSFVKKINMIDNSTYSLKKYSIASKKWALKYCANAEAIFEDFIKELAE